MNLYRQATSFDWLYNVSSTFSMNSFRIQHLLLVHCRLTEKTRTVPQWVNHVAEEDISFEWKTSASFIISALYVENVSSISFGCRNLQPSFKPHANSISLILNQYPFCFLFSIVNIDYSIYTNTTYVGRSHSACFTCGSHKIQFEWFLDGTTILSNDDIIESPSPFEMSIWIISIVLRMVHWD